MKHAGFCALVRNRVRIDDAGSILNFRTGFSFEKRSALAGQFGNFLTGLEWIVFSAFLCRVYILLVFCALSCFLYFCSCRPLFVFFPRLSAFRENFWKKGKDPHPRDKIQHLDFTKDARPLYYKTPPCTFYHKDVRSKAVFGP